MRVLRALLAIAGAAVCVVGLLTILAPDTAAMVPVDDAVALLGNDYLVVAVLGIVGAAATIGVMLRQSIRGVDQATPPDPEGPPTGRRPGSRFDDSIGGWHGMALLLRPGRRERVRERLLTAAVGALSRTAGCSREEARRRVERGAWTDDPEAAAFLASHRDTKPLATVGVMLRGGSPVSRRARRTVDAIERLNGDDQK